MITNTEQLKEELEFQVMRLKEGIEHHNKLMEDYADEDPFAYNYHLGSACGLELGLVTLNKIIKEYF